MQWILEFCFTTLCALTFTAASPPTTTVSRIDFYEEAQREDLNRDELDLLKPIIDNLQKQYDEILTKVDTNSTIDENGNHLTDSLLAVLQHFTDKDVIFETQFEYNVNLPTFSDFRGTPMQGIPLREAHDMENILQENIDDANQTIYSIIDRSNKIEAMLLSINKIKILKFIYKALGNIFTVAVRVSRAAYCTYSYIPIINSTITEGRTNIGSCYINSRNSIKHLRNEVQTSINQIRTNVVELVNIYKKIAKRESLLGKLFTLLMNVSKITDDIKDTRSTAYNTIDEVKTEVPMIIASTRECSTYAIPSFVRQLNETITGLTTCINFVDDSTQGPEPEPESSEEESEEESLEAQVGRS